MTAGGGDFSPPSADSTWPDIATVADQQVAADAYVNHRTGWDKYLTRLAPEMAFSAEEIDPAGTNPLPSPDPGKPASAKEAGDAFSPGQANEENQSHPAAEQNEQPTRRSAS